MIDREEFKRQEKQLRLELEVVQLYYDCEDFTVMKYFDPDSDKELEKKAMVLRAINSGETVSDEDYLSILEKLPRDENGKPLVTDW